MVLPVIFSLLLDAENSKYAFFVFFPRIRVQGVLSFFLGFFPLLSTPDFPISNDALYRLPDRLERRESDFGRFRHKLLDLSATARRTWGPRLEGYLLPILVIISNRLCCFLFSKRFPFTILSLPESLSIHQISALPRHRRSPLYGGIRFAILRIVLLDDSRLSAFYVLFRFSIFSLLPFSSLPLSSSAL